MENEQNYDNLGEGSPNVDIVPEMRNKKILFPVELAVLTVVYAVFLAITAGLGWVLIFLIWFGTPLVFGVLFKVCACNYAKRAINDSKKVFLKTVEWVLFSQIVAIALALLIAFISNGGKVNICLDSCKESSVLGLLPYMIIYATICSFISIAALAIGKAFDERKKGKSRNEKLD